MAKRDKRLAALKRNPRNVRPDMLESILISVGFTARQEGSSHRVYSHGGHRISVPQRRPYLLETYVKQAVALIEAITEEGDDEPLQGS